MTQVQTDETNSNRGDIQLGVVTDSPDTFALPSDFWIFSSVVVCVIAAGVARFGHMVRFRCCNMLVARCLPIGSLAWSEVW